MTIEFKIIPAYQANMAADLNATTTLGIEVTVPAVAGRCGLGNIDHHGKDCTSETPSACEQVLANFFDWMYCSNPEEQSRGKRQTDQFLGKISAIVGNVGDSDTITSMALLRILTDNLRISDYGVLSTLVSMIGAVDRLGAASAIGQDGNKYAEHSLIKAIVAVSGSREMDLEQQIKEVVQILTAQRASGAAEKAVEESEKIFEAAKKASKVTILDSGIVLVESSHHAATRIGYEHGDVLICLNKRMLKDFKDPTAGTYRKLTVCKRDENVQAVINFDRLNELEQAAGTWGGRSTVGGSPQGADSTLTIEQAAGCIGFPWKRIANCFDYCTKCGVTEGGGEDIHGDWVCTPCASVTYRDEVI